MIRSKIFLAFALIISLVSCKAQTLPLNTYFKNVPQGAYLKDLNNELVPYAVKMGVEKYIDLKFKIKTLIYEGFLCNNARAMVV